MTSPSTQTYLTTDELAARIKYDARTIRNRLKDAVLFEGVHYIRPFGGRKILFIWEAIERDMVKVSTGETTGPSNPRAPHVECTSVTAVSRPTGPARRIGRSTSIPMAAGGACHV